MKPWQKIWRAGIAPFLPERGLQALADALQNDDPQLLQGFTTDIPLLEAWNHREIQGACALGFCGWQGLGLRTLQEVTSFFESTCQRADRVLGEPGFTRQFLDWYDRVPRSEMRSQLLPEVFAELRNRLRQAA